MKTTKSQDVSSDMIFERSFMKILPLVQKLWALEGRRQIIQLGWKVDSALEVYRDRFYPYEPVFEFL
jgi:hypothetical protein